MTTQQPEQFRDADELLLYNEKFNRAILLPLQPLKADQAIAHMAQRHALLGDTANHFVPKDFTKPKQKAVAEFVPLESEPKPKVNAYEQELQKLKENNNGTTPEIDQDLARHLVELSMNDYVANGIQMLEDLANTQEKSNV